MATPGHAALMDRVYRRQRHVYDLTRKYYLLGRDELIAGLAPPAGGSIIELGCGTGRNLAEVARVWPDARLFGLDISSAMLATARANLAGLGNRVRLARGDAAAFDGGELFGQPRFDRVIISYALSMIPPWEGAIAAALSSLAPGGQLHIVDFGRQERLPSFVKAGLRAWLRRFHVTPRDALADRVGAAAAGHDGKVALRSIRRGFAVIAIVTLPEG